MRRISKALGAVALAAAVAVAVPGSAQAATGQLRVGFKTYNNPSGCYQSDIWPLIVENLTDKPADVHDRPGCEGPVIGVVNPGETKTFEFGASVRIA
ncbi:hypothetical protein ACFV84_04595 [Kitasatospora sp. NPDC059811]|uniref:hypothetical protein n=1 Tax=Streptomycetaceae TaxID=2062 RepID=UPI0007AF5C8A|nr:hypothetical protein [Streptomyces sp. MJM8645]